MSLLREIQDAAIDTKVDISVVLRKCMVLASRLSNREFEQWVDRELNGFKAKEEVPEYRIVDTQSQGHFVGPYGREMIHVPIPISSVPEKYRPLVAKHYMMEPISHYANLMKEGGDRDGLLRAHWNADLIAHVATKIIRGMNLMSAWCIMTPSVIAGLLDTVRNRVLSFVLQIEAEMPDAGEASTETQPIAEEKVTHIFNTTIGGSVGALAVGGALQVGQVAVATGDLESLKNYLASTGIKCADLSELETAIQKDASTGERSSIGSNVASWTAKMLAKAGTGAWKVATTVAGELLTRAIASYYGLK